MNIPLQITFRNMPPSEAIEAKINEKAAKLEKYYNRIVGCRVVVEETQRRHHQGKLFSIHINITVPGKELAMTHAENEDPHVAVRDAFNTAARMLEEHARQRRGEVKSHEAALTGRIIRIVPDQSYGFIITADQREIYFHRNSVINNDFDTLKFGAEVSFVEEQGKEGPQAVRVTIIK